MPTGRDTESLNQKPQLNRQLLPRAGGPLSTVPSFESLDLQRNGQFISLQTSATSAMSLEACMKNRAVQFGLDEREILFNASPLGVNAVGFVP